MAFVNALRKFSVFSTNNVDEAETILTHSLVDAQVMKVFNRDRFGFQLNMFSLGSISFVGNRYESYTEIASGESGIHENTMHFILGGGVASEFSVNDESFIVSETNGVVLIPRKKIKVKRHSGSEILILRITSSDLKEYYEVLLEQQFRGDIKFQPNVDLSQGAGAFLKRLTTNLLLEIQQDEEVIHNQAIRKGYSDLFLSAMLQLPHTVPVALSKNRLVHIASKYVVRAEEYMRAHLSEPISIADLLKICRCSRTTLYSCFRSTRGYTPMEFLVEQRLQIARHEIITSSAETTIASIAMKCGFSHLSRFSQAYRTRFEELPSETSRKL